ncbi:hypothetical protein SCHPADRAFT_738156 [Schizopora paradoxa]|uniref:Uncharacterized protein n=1 Tax=Schizopora paradoxa TaxID=27342 RepID=A0A0H2R192_9AGAM|nr:hypothetical protein SCHPADRAFT_738156 [Schizopora paradoxa]
MIPCSFASHHNIEHPWLRKMAPFKLDKLKPKFWKRLRQRRPGPVTTLNHVDLQNNAGAASPLRLIGQPHVPANEPDHAHITTSPSETSNVVSRGVTQGIVEGRHSFAPNINDSPSRLRPRVPHESVWNRQSIQVQDPVVRITEAGDIQRLYLIQAGRRYQFNDLDFDWRRLPGIPTTAARPLAPLFFRKLRRLI